MGFGNNLAGQLCAGTSNYLQTPSLISTLGYITQISAGYTFSLFLTNNGDVYGCGDNRFV